MNNKEIARAFSNLADLMELHNQNPFKVRSYANAYISLRKIENPLADMEESDIASVKGVGNSVAKKVKELLETGKMEALESLKEITPVGIQQILSIRGIGPKKVKQVWKELGAESPGELLYACYENRLVELNGFGFKTQENYKEKIEYFLDSQEKSLFASIEDDVIELHEFFKEHFPGQKCHWVGELARKVPVITHSEFILEKPVTRGKIEELSGIEVLSWEESHAEIRYKEKVKLKIHFYESDVYEFNRFKLTGDAAFIKSWASKFEEASKVDSQDQIFTSVGLPVIPPEIMEGERTFDLIMKNGVPNLIDLPDIKGILHNHSTYSDGLHSLKDMSDYVRDRGFAYFGICDHSQSAFYANGMKPDRVLEQFSEIDKLNAEMSPFKVFKGIESDILNDGSLDYEDEILEQFDFVVASVHSNLRMDEQKATSRLITAVENPYTRILGHPTSRLLLSREGYPIDYRKVIDACSANGVVIELNANPLRLDLDYKWIPYAMEKNVQIAINPDAHSKEAIHLVRFGVLAARKGWLSTEMCLNTLSVDEFERWVSQK